MPKFTAPQIFSMEYFCSKFKNFFFLVLLCERGETAFSTAVAHEEHRQHVFLLLGYQGPNSTTGISSFLTETLIGLAATNLIGH